MALFEFDLAAWYDMAGTTIQPDGAVLEIPYFGNQRAGEIRRFH